MSQFLMCASERNIDFFCDLVDESLLKNSIFLNVKNMYFDSINMKNIWIMKKIDRIFCEAQTAINSGTSFSQTQLYDIIDRLCNMCEIVVLWYGNFYEDLDVCLNKQEVLSNVKKSISYSECECYLVFRKQYSI